MDFFKVKGFRKARKPNPEKELEDKPVPPPEEMKIENGNGNDLSKSDNVDPACETEEDDDDDFILNEVKRRMKELRRNSFMVLIPEESCPDEEEEEETSSSGCRGSETEDCQQWCSFDALYDKYCERMLFFDRMSAQRLLEAGSQVQANPSPRSASKKLSSTLRSLSFKKKEEPQENGDQEYLQPQQDDPYQDLETAYVAQICLTWEALHCQYTQLNQKISSEPENPTCYSHVAQLFQQFQVLLQRFVENEPFEQGLRAEIYARTRNSFTKLLQVPSLQVSDKKERGEEGVEEEESDAPVLTSDLIRIIEASILTFHLFLKMDKKKPSKILNLFGGQNQIASPLQQIQSSLDKKMLKIKDLCKKKKGWKKKSWPATAEEVQLLFGLIDIKVTSRALRMVRISKEQLVWCEEKMSKLDVSESKLKRDGSPILFPC
ncbi:Ribosomal protein L34Ae [Macleaya cordata]|uniref:Ribosomal protein L34Ae n=1 Tax=Macleaya cordata TaxID=56857 RepID=A0A200R991_MACCD|nr:Ribosomal protein L34Ae [Macleaya cordata]